MFSFSGIACDVDSVYLDILKTKAYMVRAVLGFKNCSQIKANVCMSI